MSAPIFTFKGCPTAQADTKANLKRVNSSTLQKTPPWGFVSEIILTLAPPMVNKRKCIPKMHRINLSPLLLFCLFTQSSSAWSTNSHVDIGDTGTHIFSQSYHLASQVDNHNSDFYIALFNHLPNPRPRQANQGRKKTIRKIKMMTSGADFTFVFMAVSIFCVSPLVSQLLKLSKIF